jgi:twitching motility protein PilI
MTSLALQSFDQLCQSYAFDAVTPPSIENTEMYWVGTSLGVAGVPLLLGEGELEEIIETPVSTVIPGTKHWVMGVASHKGGLLPIISGDELFRKVVYTGRSREYCMVIRRPGFHFAITLSQVERDIKFPVELRDMTHDVDPDFSDYCLGGFHYRNNFLAVLDIDKLLVESGLANASAVNTVLTEESNND